MKNSLKQKFTVDRILFGIFTVISIAIILFVIWTLLNTKNLKPFNP